MSNGRIVLDRISKTYERGGAPVRALADLTLTIEPGELVVLLGPSGSGKTTLLNLIGAIETPTSGGIRVCDVDVEALSGRALDDYRRDVVGFVFQFFNLVPTLTASENVEVIAELLGSDAVRRTVDALGRVGLHDRAGHFPGQLSGGEQQRVAIARALVKRAPVVLADEPTGSLDLETGRQVLGLLRDAADAGTTVVIVTHNTAIAALADRILHLSDGRLVSDRRNAGPAAPSAVTW